MLHGPCGPRYPNSPCMVDGVCSKKFPRDFVEETKLGDDAYASYARPNDGREFIVRKGNQEFVMTNRDVVPYNAYLSLNYGCHLNVEVCASIKCVTYIHK